MPLRFCWFAAACLLPLFGCQRADRPGAEAPAAPAETAAAPSPVTAWDPPPAPDRDLGVGVVYFRMGTPPQQESLSLRDRPDPSAEIVAAFAFSMPTGEGWTYDVVRRDGAAVRPNLVEHGYEESGLPVDSISGDGHWVRVVYGYGADDAPLLGWAEVDGRVEVLLWRDWLPERASFLLDPRSADLHAAQGGAALYVALEPTGGPPPYEFDYHIEVDSVAGDWARVTVVTPSDACGMQPAEPVRRTTAWTRLFDERGRPRVWYHSRGC